MIRNKERVHFGTGIKRQDISPVDLEVLNYWSRTCSIPSKRSLGPRIYGKVSFHKSLSRSRTTWMVWEKGVKWSYASNVWFFILARIFFSPFLKFNLKPSWSAYQIFFFKFINVHSIIAVFHFYFISHHLENWTTCFNFIYIVHPLFHPSSFKQKWENTTCSLKFPCFLLKNSLAFHSQLFWAL